MELLNRKDGSRRGRFAVLGLCLFVSACFLLGTGEQAVVFDHALHVDEEGLDCTMCHSTVEDEDAAGMPMLGLCQTCHAGIDEEKPVERRVATLFDEEGKYKTTLLADIPDEVLFSHSSHYTDYELECSDCHGNVGESSVIPPESAVTKDECMDCHASRGKSNDCASCHSEIDENWAPPSHRRSWDFIHGQVVRSESQLSSNRCAMCHDEQQSCQACHQREAPRNHTNTWRRRTHGLMVSIDRSNCITCHRRDFCVRCHENTEPRSHRASFGSPRNRHCISCHEPLRGESCFTCHKGTPSHNMALPLPSDHLPSMNCRQCHGAGLTAPLPHPDNGTQCTSCHR
ncbi:MAG: cytochrome c3 family protein [Planctomycetota bacterium]|jgi:hypothetical protein